MWQQYANRRFNEQVPRNQHSVPRFWLNHFADGRKRAYLANAKTGTWSSRPVSTKRIAAYERLYDIEIYGAEISFEQMFAFWEDKAAKLISEIKGQAAKDMRSGEMGYKHGINLFINEPYRRWVLSYFFALSYLRSEPLLSSVIEETTKRTKDIEQELNVQVGDHFPKQVAFSILYGNIERQDTQIHYKFGSPITEKIAF